MSKKTQPAGKAVVIDSASVWLEEASDRISLAIAALTNDFSKEAIEEFNNLLAARDELIDLAYERATGKRATREPALPSAARSFEPLRL